MSETSGNCVKVTYLNDPRLAELEKEVAGLRSQNANLQEWNRRDSHSRAQLHDQLREELDATEMERARLEGMVERLLEDNERDSEQRAGDYQRLAEKLKLTEQTLAVMGLQSAEWCRERDEAIAEVERLKRGDWTADELTELGKVVMACDAWASFLSNMSVEYSVGEDGVERYGFETVTVFRREGREASTRLLGGVWISYTDGQSKNFPQDWRREDAEAWCVEQLKPAEPEWRPAKDDGSDNGKACRFRDGGGSWFDGKLLMYEPASDGPWIVLRDGLVYGWDECEVQD